MVGTIFEDTKLSLSKWFLNVKRGLSSRQLGRDLGINRNTAWYLQMRIRKAMEEGKDKGLLKGIVEIDETYIGGAKTNHSKKKRQAICRSPMTTIKLLTEINSPIEKCFDLARDIDFHKLSTQKTKEKAVAGRTSGLCELGDKITWEATESNYNMDLKRNGHKKRHR